MAEKRHVQHVRSKVVEQNGQPKLPQGSDLLYGELAVNYHKGTETISLKNDQDEIVAFHDEVEITSGNPKINTEIWIDTGDNTVTEVYTKQDIDTFLGSINDKDYEQDDRIDALERKTDDMSGGTISEIEEAINEMSGMVDTRIAQLEERDNELEELAKNAYEIQIGPSGSTMSANTEIFIDTDADSSVQLYTKNDVDTFINAINEKDYQQDNRLDALEEKTSELTGDTINEIKGSIEALEGIVETKVDNSSFNDYSASTEAEIESLEEAVIDATEIQIGNSASTISSNTKVYIDTDEDASVQIYTKAQIDSQVNGINNKDYEQDARLDALENGGTSSSTKIDEISGSVETLSSDLASLSDVVANNIVISSSAPSGADTELFVDTSGDGPQFEVYTKAQVDSMIAYLQAQIDELKNS